MDKQQIDKKVFSKDEVMKILRDYMDFLNHQRCSDDKFYEMKMRISSILGNKWIREKKELAQQLKLARNSCRIKKQKSLANHIILALGYLRNED